MSCDHDFRKGGVHDRAIRVERLQTKAETLGVVSYVLGFICGRIVADGNATEETIEDALRASERLHRGG